MQYLHTPTTSFRDIFVFYILFFGYSIYCRIGPWLGDDPVSASVTSKRLKTMND